MADNSFLTELRRTANPCYLRDRYTWQKLWKLDLDQFTLATCVRNSETQFSTKMWLNKTNSTEHLEGRLINSDSFRLELRHDLDSRLEKIAILRAAYFEGDKRSELPYVRTVYVLKAEPGDTVSYRERRDWKLRHFSGDPMDRQVEISSPEGKAAHPKLSRLRRMLRVNLISEHPLLRDLPMMRK